MAQHHVEVVAVPPERRAGHIGDQVEDEETILRNGVHKALQPPF